MSALAVMSTFSDYTYDLRKSFRTASREGLGALESQIRDIGYDWLDDYVAECEARVTSRAPITQLMKTPSRTATAKKTRAGTAAGQDKTNKLRLVNAASPTQKTSSSSNARLPLSPLGARSMNVASPALEVPSPKHAKTSPVKKGPKGGKGKGKKGKGKKGEAAMTSPLRPAQEDIAMEEPTEEPEPMLTRSVMSPRSKGGLPRTIALSDAMPAASKPAPANTEIAVDPVTSPINSANTGRDGDQVAESSSAAATISKPSAPHRQVRSSWLSKALGGGPVPDSNRDALRKSTIAPGTKFGPVDYEYPSNRKSLAPVGGLKRKSEVPEEPSRPEKVTRVEEPLPLPVVQPPMAALGRPPFDRQLSRENAVRESIFPSRPTLAPVAQPQMPGGIPDLAASRPVGVEKVTSALDKFREIQHAKEQALKAKAAAAVRPSTAAPPTTTGAGFLRGLGNIGAGLGRSLGLASASSSAKHSHDLQKRLEDEEEEKRRASLEAKRELAILLRNSPDKVKEPAPPVPAKSKSTTSPLMSPPAAAALSGLAGAIDDAMSEDAEEEETHDEARVLEDLDDLHPADPDIPSVPTKKARGPVVHSPPRPPRQDLVSTTPMDTPPRAVSPKAAPPVHARNEKHVRSSPSRPPRTVPVAALPPKEMLLVKHDSDRSIAASSQPSKSSSAASKQNASMAPDSRPPSSVDCDMEPEPEEGEDEDEESTARYAYNAGKGMTKSSSQQSLAMSTTSSTSMFSTAATIAGKVLGVRPQPGNVKSLQMAAAAQKKEQMAAHDRKALREAAERRKQEQADKKAEEDRVKADEERRRKVAELDEKRRARAEAEKIRKENEEKKAANARAKAAREEREKEKELAAAKAKAEEEAKKRKLLQAGLNKSTAATNGLKKIGPPMPLAAAAPTAPAKPVQTIKLVSSSAAIAASSSSTIVAPGQSSKLGPGVFRTEQTASAAIVAQQPVTAAGPRALGPPARPSAMAMSSQAQAIRNSVAVAQSSVQAGPHSTTLQQSRVALQMQLDEKVAEVQSEDIVLPDIASEYSDSDDEDRTRDFERPQWAESPDLRAALEQQATRDPDELFGPIQPLNMEELFKARTNKFRARSSSANWHKGDGLTRAEEIEYARRMGFKPSNLSQG